MLKPGGVLYATFGPLYFCWGGDHFSGRKRFEEGYNHLLLNESDYAEYIEGFHREDDPDNGRRWARENMFSRWRWDQYLECFNRMFDIQYCWVMISPEGLRFRRRFPEAWAGVRASTHVGELNFLVKGISVILRKTPDKM